MIRLFAFAVCLIVCGWLTPVYADVELGKPAPSLVVKQLDGKTFTLANEKGKVVIVNFWATWCPPCRDEMPLLDTLYKRYQSQGLELIGISVDRDTHRRQAELIMKNFSYPSVMQNDATDNGFGWMSVVPDTYIVDRQGVVRVKAEGVQLPMDEGKMAEILVPLLKAK